MNEMGFYLRKGWPLLLIVLAVAVAFYISNSFAEKIDYQIESAQTQLSELKSEMALTQKRVGDYNESRAAIRQYADYLFTKQDPQKLIDRLKSDALTFNVRLSDIQIDIPGFFKDRDKSKTVIPIKFRAVFTGDYFDLGDFLQELEQRPYLDVIEKMDIASMNPEGENLQMSISGAFRLFDEKILEWCLNDGT